MFTSKEVQSGCIASGGSAQRHHHASYGWTQDLGDQCAIIDLEDLMGQSSMVREEGTAIAGPMSCKTRSDFYPVNSRDKVMNEFQKMIERDLTRPVSQISVRGTIFNDNLSTEERELLMRLSRGNDFVIKNSGKEVWLLCKVLQLTGMGS